MIYLNQLIMSKYNNWKCLRVDYLLELIITLERGVGDIVLVHNDNKPRELHLCVITGKDGHVRGKVGNRHLMRQSSTGNFQGSKEEMNKNKTLNKTLKRTLQSKKPRNAQRWQY